MPKREPLSPVEEWKAKKQERKIRNEQRKALASLCNSMANAIFAAGCVSVLVSAFLGNSHATLKQLQTLFFCAVIGFLFFLFASQKLLERLEIE